MSPIQLKLSSDMIDRNDATHDEFSRKMVVHNVNLFLLRARVGANIRGDSPRERDIEPPPPKALLHGVFPFHQKYFTQGRYYLSRGRTVE